jgi:cytoskeletal protein CcmA (bactofilin family)
MAENNDFEVDLEPEAWEVSGYTKFPAGKFLQDINVNGYGLMEGNFECDSIHINGLLRAKSALLLHGDLNSAGSFHGRGPFISEGSVNIAGTAKFHDRMKVEGSFVLDGKWKAKNDVAVGDSCKASGLVKIKGNLVVGGNLTIKGRAVIKGQITGKNVKIRPADHGFSLFPLKSKIYGNVLAKGQVELEKCIVFGDITAKEVVQGKNCDVRGKIQLI